MREAHCARWHVGACTASACSAVLHVMYGSYRCQEWKLRTTLSLLLVHELPGFWICSFARRCPCFMASISAHFCLMMQLSSSRRTLQNRGRGTHGSISMVCSTHQVSCLVIISMLMNEGLAKLNMASGTHGGVPFAMLSLAGPLFNSMEMSTVAVSK